jgi:heterodisulfide reductase subunit C
MAASRIDLAFAEEVATSEAFNAWACLNCGVCSAVCPMGIDLMPRTLFRYAILGLKDELLAETDSIYQCLLCKLCEENCMSGVHIVENMRFLRGYIDDEVFGLDAGRDSAAGRKPAAGEDKEGSHAPSHA